MTHKNALSKLKFARFPLNSEIRTSSKSGGGFFEFLNPTHKYDFIGKPISGIAYLFDFLVRSNIYWFWNLSNRPSF
jgi:hypothetical protein